MRCGRNIFKKYSLISTFYNPGKVNKKHGQTSNVYLDSYDSRSKAHSQGHINQNMEDKEVSVEEEMIPRNKL